MIILKSSETLSNYIFRQRTKRKQIGFVPTMGALHQGHISLIDECRKANDVTVCSIFINPTQFNNSEDLKHYPVTIERDIEQLVAAKCDVLFLPSFNEVYPPGYTPVHYNLGYLENILEGRYRPGHFQGVCQVVDRLLEIVKPDQLFLGQKDYQQCMVIRRLLELTGRDISLQICPTVREDNGLAMSSRNLRLSPDEKQKASMLYQALKYIAGNASNQSPEAVRKEAESGLHRYGFDVDYLELVDAETLMPSPAANTTVALVAATLGKIRLIDNLVISGLVSAEASEQPMKNFS